MNLLIGIASLIFYLNNYISFSEYPQLFFNAENHALLSIYRNNTIAPNMFYFMWKCVDKLLLTL